MQYFHGYTAETIFMYINEAKHNIQAGKSLNGNHIVSLVCNFFHNVHKANERILLIFRNFGQVHIISLFITDESKNANVITETGHYIRLSSPGLKKMNRTFACLTAAI